MNGSGVFELAIVAVLRNEAPYVEEWIAYHTVVGVEHFFIYENNSDDDIRAVLCRYIAHGLVTLIDFPIGGAQVPAYSHAVHCVSGSARWLAPLDLDEFIVPKVDADVPAMLRRLGDADRVVLPWRNFGMAGHRTRPPGLVIENFVMAEDVPAGGFEQMSVKSISRPSAITGVGIHTQVVSSDSTVDADGRRVEMREVKLLRPSYRSAQINHYITKSEAEFAAKIARGEANRDLSRRPYKADEEHGFDTRDDSIERFVEPTRQRLAEHRALSATPFRYGSQVHMRLPHPDPFLKHVTLSVSNYLHGVPMVRNGTHPVANLMAGDRRAFVARVDDRDRAHDLGPFADSPHVADMARRLEAGMRWRVDDATTITHDAPLTMATGTGDERRHLTFAAVVSCDGPTTVCWSTRGSTSTATIETPLPEPGRYVCVVETNRHLDRCDIAAMSVARGGSITVHELLLLRYG